MLIHLRRLVRKTFPVALLAAALFVLAATSIQTQANGWTYTREDAEMLTRLIWGEARGCGQTQQAAVVWCVLNRVDSALFPNTISEVITQPRQFAGYNTVNPVDPQILALVYDVLSRWSIEDNCVGGVGRVLPREYLFFSGNGTVNRFRVTYSGSDVWDWSLPTPYNKRTDEIQTEIPIRTQTDWDGTIFVYYPALIQGEI